MANAKRNVLALGLASFFNDMGSEMILPLLPLFIISTLGAPATVLGLIEGVAGSTASLLMLLSGALSDRLGKRKALVAAGYGLSAVTKPLFAAATAWPHVLAVRFADRVGKGVRDAPRDALLAASIGKGVRGGAFGLRQAMDTSGAIVGTLLAAALLAMAFTYRQIFLFAFVPTAMAVLVVAFFAREVAHAPMKKMELPWKNRFGRQFGRFMAVVAVFNIANFSYAFYLLRAQEAGLAIVLVPIIYLVYNVCYAATAYPAGRLSDRMGRKQVIGAGYLLFALTAAGFATLADTSMLWPLFVLYGLQIALTDSVSRAFITDIVGEVKRGTALGAYHMTVGLAALPASIIAGFVWDAYGSAVTFGLAAGLALIAVLMLGTVGGKAG
ncbi:MAG: MFS transporter [Candidatus Aenigmatarchaeota archaeon]